MTNQNPESRQNHLPQSQQIHSPESAMDLEKLYSLTKIFKKKINETLDFVVSDEEIQELLEENILTNKDQFFEYFALLDTPSNISKFNEIKKTYDELVATGIYMGDLFVDQNSPLGEKWKNSVMKMVRKRNQSKKTQIAKRFKRNIEDGEKLLEEKLKDENLTPLKKKAIEAQIKKIKSGKSVKEIAPVDIKVEAQKAKKEIEEMVDGNYLDWMAYNVLYLRDLLRSFKKSGRLVVTPHIQNILDEIDNREGQTVFLKGDLGSGKTEMALYYGRLYAEKNKEKILGRMIDDGYNFVKEDEIKQAFDSLSEEELNELREEYKKRTKEEALDQNIYELFRHKYCSKKEAISEDSVLEPVLLSGHKEFDPAQFIGGFELTVPYKFNDEDVVKLFEDAKKDIEEMKDLTEKEKELLLKARLDFKKPSGIQTKAYLGKLFHAMKYGRVLVIDEVNAMPHEILILLNHYITRKVGETVQPPINNLPPFTVASGYKLILTGNVPKEGQSGYTGRQMMDAAFRNRLGEISVDYLPNTSQDEITLTAEYDAQISILGFDKAKKSFYDSLTNEQKTILRRGGIFKNGETELKVNGEYNNELFQVLACFGLEDQIISILPENYFEKLRDLSKASRIIQDAFGGKSIDAKFRPANTKGNLSLKRAVPSMRDLTLIVQKWRDDKFKLSLDKYVWKYYVQKFDDDKEEQNFVYTVLKNYGFFVDDYFREKLPNDNPAEFEMIGDMDYLEEDLPKKIFTQEEVLISLFGPAPDLSSEELELIDSSVPEVENLQALKEEFEDEIETTIQLLQDELDEIETEVYQKYCVRS